MWLARRLAALVGVLTLSLGNLAICGGWQPTPEARMACCTKRTSCPMHKSEPDDSTRALTQAQADTCCAATSSRTQSSVVDSMFALSSVTPLPVATGLVTPAHVPALAEWRAFVPLPVSPVPKHLLLSVLLV